MSMPEQDLAGKILHVLSIYPKISPSMLQIALNIQAATWKPILEELISKGLVRRSHIVSPTPTGRHQTYTVLGRNPSTVLVDEWTENMGSEANVN